MAAPYVLAEQIAEQPPEVLVPRVRQEAARIGHHADEPRQQAHVGERVHLLRHAVELIEEPPGRSVLHLPGHGAVLEVADHGREQRVVARVEVVEDGLRELIRVVEPVEEARERPGDLEVADRIEARVRPERPAHPRVVVAEGAEMELLNPAAGVIEQRELVKKRRLQRRRRRDVERVPRAEAIKGRVRLRAGPRVGEHRLEAMVRRAAPHLVEGIVAGLQRVEQRREPAADRPPARRLEARDVRIPRRRRLRRRTPCPAATSDRRGCPGSSAPRVRGGVRACRSDRPSCRPRPRGTVAAGPAW